MDGSLSDEDQLIKDSFRKYCESKILPRQEAWNRKGSFPRAVMKEISELALPATISEEFGGGQLAESTIGLFSELMGMYEFPVPAFLTMHFAKLLPLVADSSARSEYLDRYLRGDLVVCGAFTEPGFGSDSASIVTQASRRDKDFVVNGEKAYVSSPGIADVHIFSVRTSRKESGNEHRGISLMLADSNTRGVESYETESMASIFTGDFGGIRFSEALVPEGHLVGEENRGFATLMRILNVQRVHVALYSIGLAEKSLAEAIDYAGMRNTFGKPISSHQAVSFRLAEDWTRLESVKLLAYKALAMQEKGLENSAECAAVKWHGCEVAFEAVSHALQTFGAAGYVRTSPLERRFRAARGFLIGDGTPDIQKLIISRRLFGREHSP